MTNRYPGTCACGANVAAGAGEAVKLGGRWTVRCTGCKGSTGAQTSGMGRVLVNRYPGRCTCGRDVDAGAGTAVKGSDGRWGVRCAICAADANLTPEPAAPQDSRRAIAPDGAISIPYSEDEGQRALLRSLPPPGGRGSAWDGEAKRWRASVSPAELRRTLEVARRLNLEIAPELLERERTEKTTEARAAASIPGLYHFQVAGVEFLASGKNRLLADDQGCIDGEALVRLNRAGKGFSMKLSDLCRRFNGGSGHGKRWDPGIPTYIRSLCDGDLRLNLVSKVLDKGVRPVVKLALASGKTLRLTPDHEVATAGDIWVRADSLKPGDSVLTNGQAACKLCGSTERVSTYPYAKFVGVCRTCIYRKLREKPTYKDGRRPDKTGYILVSGQWDHPHHDPNGAVREHVLVMEQMLGRYLEPGERVHHIDGNPANNAPENLQLVSDSSHASIHGRQGGYRKMNGGRGGKGGIVQFVPVVDTVVSVEPDGETHVYDVVCADPHRNFVANGIIVHNCGKTIETLCALPREGELPPVLCIVPNVVKHNWLDEAATWAPMYRRTALSGRNSFRWPQPGEIVAINYDILPLEAEAPTRKTKKEEKPEAAMAREAAHLKFTASAPRGLVVVIDEAHNCRNNSARTRRVRGIVGCASRAWGLTGTPLLNHPDQLWRVLQSLDLAGLVFGGWNNFTRLFHASRNRWGGWVWGAPMPEVPERLRRAMLRRIKAEVLPDLPAKRYQVLTCNGIGEAMRRELDRLWEEWQEVVQGDEDLPPFEKFSEIRQKLAAARTPAVLEWVEPYEDAGEPLVVFSAHRAPIDELGKREGWATITGDTPAAKRTEIVARFQAGELRGVACTIVAAGVGLTLTRAATALFVDLDWTPALNIQAQDRLHRIGQTAQSVLYVRMVSDHPLDLHIQSLIAKKMEMIAASIERLVKVDPAALAAQPGGVGAGIVDPGIRLDSAEDTRAAILRAADALRDAEAQEQKREARERCQSITVRQREKLGAEAPELKLTPTRVQTIKDALDAMLGVCDGAVEKDGVGFNKPDAVRSRWLKVLGLDDEDAQRCALSMLQGYRRQLGERFPCLWRDRK